MKSIIYIIFDIINLEVLKERIIHIITKVEERKMQEEWNIFEKVHKEFTESKGNNLGNVTPKGLEIEFKGLKSPSKWT